jgi:DNA-3-methyladenine glycosylase II
MRRIETDADIDEGLAALGKIDPRLQPVIDRVGKVPLRRAPAGFASMVSIIVAQQISRASADAILGRFGKLVDPLNAASVAMCGEAIFRKAGLSRPKQATLIALARAVVDGEIDLEHLTELDADAARAKLIAIHGIGPWTADVYLLVAAGHPDVFPAGDVALQGAAADVLGLEARPTKPAMGMLAESWSPWRAIAARLLWAHWRMLRGRDAAPSLVEAERLVKTA